ncbi:MAG: hypothetical protein ACRDB9_07610 [Cetobacterium sp.]
MGGYFRKKEIKFTQVSNSAIDDERLSLKAQGLYVKIQRYITIPGFVLYKSTLIKKCSDGETSFRSAWKELKDAGYLKQYKFKDEDTGKWKYEYDLLDEANLDIPSETIQNTQSENPHVENPHVENPHVENPHVENPQVENPPVYNNTYLNNTYLNNTDVVVVVYKGQEKTNTVDTVDNITNSLDLSIKGAELLKKISLAKLEITYAQIRMLEKLNYTIANKALELTIAQGGKKFSYFYKIYQGEENNEIENFLQETKCKKMEIHYNEKKTDTSHNVS